MGNITQVKSIVNGLFEATVVREGKKASAIASTEEEAINKALERLGISPETKNKPLGLAREDDAFKGSSSSSNSGVDFEDENNDLLAAAGFVGTGAIAGAGLSAVVGGMGLAVAGTAVGIGMAPLAIAGGVLGMAGYGIFKLFGGGQDQKKDHDQKDQHDQKVGEWANKYKVNPYDMGPRNYQRCLHDIGLGGECHDLEFNEDGSLKYQ